MQIESAEQFEALSRLKRLERVQRLRGIAKGPSWLRGRMLFLAGLVGGVAWITLVGDTSEQRLTIWVLIVSMSAVAGIEESLGRRIDAVLDLLELEREHAAGDVAPKAPSQASARQA